LVPPAFVLLRSSINRPQICYVAGARYNEPLGDLNAGDVVELRRIKVEGTLAIGVFRSEQQLGWIPKSMLTAVPPHLTRATLSRVSLHAVPWRWYQLALG
jgi:hypothetical protein